MFTSRDMLQRRHRSRLQRPRRQRSGAFTLVEIVLALVILALLAGALYSVVDAAMEGAAELQVRQDRSREIGAFLSLCRNTFSGMPGTATFQARVVQDGQRYSTEMVFRNAPGFLGWGGAGNSYRSTILGVRGLVGGLAGVGILQDSEANITAYLDDSTAPTRPWLMLISDLRDVQWRFFDKSTSSWVKIWNNPTARPAYAELTLSDADGAHTYIFRIPPLAISLQPAAQQMLAPD